MRSLAAVACVVLLGCPSVRTKPVPEGTPLLWRVTHHSQPNARLELIGTLHLGREGDRVDRALEESVLQATELHVEIDLTPEEEAGMGQQMAARARLPEGETLQSKLKPETYAKLLPRLEALKIPIAAVQPLAPWALTLQLVVFGFQKQNYQPALGLDRQLLTLAHEAKIPVHSLETVESQLALLATSDPAKVDKDLLEALEVLEKPSRLEEVLTAFRSGDAKRIDDIIHSGSVGEDHARAMWTDRNRAMFEKARARFGGDRKVVVAVGAGHVASSDGLVALFEQAGFTVERLPSQGPGRPVSVEWRRHRALEFEASFPGTPVVSAPRQPSGMSATMHAVRAANAEWTIEVGMLPDGAVLPEPEALHVKVAEAMCQGRAQVPVKRITFGGLDVPKSRCSGGTPDVTLQVVTAIRGRLFVSARVISVGSPPSAQAEADAERFFASFQFVAP